MNKRVMTSVTMTGVGGEKTGESGVIVKRDDDGCGLPRSPSTGGENEKR